MATFYLTEGEMAKRLGVSPRTLKRWRREGGGPAFTRIGTRRIGYSEEAITAYAEDRTFPHRAAELAQSTARN